MAPLLKKSEDNMTAGTLLMDKGLFAPSIHCHYYCCLQRMKHAIVAKGTLTSKDIYDRGKAEKEGSHNTIVKLFKQQLGQSRMADVSRFSTAYAKLKDLRTKSDYEDMLMESNDGMDAQSRASEVIRIINRM
ncbi:MAG: hypothetical protein K9J06_08460 [Flavobacteriales bacterium]|nr:hypothetical protein [Flavobacteriales bacterium]